MYLDQAMSLGLREGIFPKVAELIEKDFNSRWFNDLAFRDTRFDYSESIDNGISPFKVDIANYMKSISNNQRAEYKDELALLSRAGKKSVGGIITTNYDCLLELVFNGYAT